MVLVLLNIVSAVAVVTPYWLTDTLSNIYGSLDGPFYVVIARTWPPYNFDQPGSDPFLGFSRYYSLHLYGYPFFIRLAVTVFRSWYLSMLIVSVTFSTLALLVFYRLARDFNYSTNPFLVSLVWMFLPVWYNYRVKGASEPTFLFFLLASFYLYKQGRYPASAFMGALASVTRIQGILALPAYAILLYRERRCEQIVWYLLIPLALGIHFAWYHLTYGDALIYFKVQQSFSIKASMGKEGFNPIPLSLLWDALDFPTSFYYQKSNYAVPFVVYVLATYYVYGLSIWRLRKNHEDLAIFSLPFFLFITLFINHQAIARYMLPFFAMPLGYDDYLTSSKIKPWIPFFIGCSYFYTLGMMTLAWLTPDKLGGIL